MLRQIFVRFRGNKRLVLQKSAGKLVHAGLADRVLVLTKRPARVAHTHELDFGGKEPLKRREAADFSGWFELLWKELNA